jgi:hypothetical protein
LQGFYEIADFSEENIYVNIPSEYGTLWGSAGQLSQMRFFVPPGTIHVGFIVHMPQNTDTAFVMRYKKLPDYIHENTAYCDLPQTGTSLARLDYLKEQDVYMCNGGGSIQLNMGYSEGLTEDEAGWLYVKVLPYNSDQIYSIIAHVKMDVPQFIAWFDLYTDWDVFGNPTEHEGPLSILCDAECQETAPIEAPVQVISVHLDYSESVFTIVGILSEDYAETQYLGSNCLFSDNFETHGSKLDCDARFSSVYKDGWVFWVVSPVPFDELDWINGSYTTYYYQMKQ